MRYGPGIRPKETAVSSILSIFLSCLLASFHNYFPIFIGVGLFLFNAHFFLCYRSFIYLLTYTTLMVYQSSFIPICHSLAS